MLFKKEGFLVSKIREAVFQIKHKFIFVLFLFFKYNYIFQVTQLHSGTVVWSSEQ